MLDSIYHMTFKIILKTYFGVNTLGFCHMRDVKTIIPKICKPLVVYRFQCMSLFHSQTRHIRIRDYLTVFWFSPSVSTQDPIISSRFGNG